MNYVKFKLCVFLVQDRAFYIFFSLCENICHRRLAAEKYVILTFRKGITRRPVFILYLYTTMTALPFTFFFTIKYDVKENFFVYHASFIHCTKTHTPYGMLYEPSSSQTIIKDNTTNTSVTNNNLKH